VKLRFRLHGETRNTGDTLEIEAVPGPDEKHIDVNLVPQSVRFDGFRDWQAEAAAMPVLKHSFAPRR
jgi:hypothetical protein